MKIAVGIVNYNQGELLNRQLWNLNKYFPDHDTIVLDNGSDEQQAIRINYWSHQHNATLIKCRNSETDPSRAHGFGCNLIYHKIKDSYDIICFLDHDMFPYKPFDFSIMEGVPIAGCPQFRGDFKYYWPGLTILNMAMIDKSQVDFMPCEVDGVFLDTGGGNYKLDGYDFAEVYVKDKLYNHSPYDFYATFDETFMHFIKTSNWNGEVPESERRINGLLVQLEENMV